MRLIGCPESHALFVDMSTQMKMGLIAEENEAENFWVVFDFFRNALTKFNPYLRQFVVLGFVSCMKTMLSLCVRFFVQMSLRYRPPVTPLC